MSSVWGKNLKISIFGSSHGMGIGVVIDNLPAGIVYDEAEVLAMLARRAPGKGDGLSTSRYENDMPEIISGIFGGRTDGSPVCALIRNTNAHSEDYAELHDTPRPSHADFAALQKYGEAVDLRGGGHFSGRLTAPLVFAGALCYGHLKSLGIRIKAHLIRVGEAAAPRYNPLDGTCSADESPLSSALSDEIEAAAYCGDSVGGKIECAVAGLPVGLGGHMFDGVEGRLSSLLFGIPAVKGVEFGLGFDFSNKRGASVNDGYRYDKNGIVATTSNNCGGVIGGMTTGMPLIFSVAMKPTPSIFLEQQTVNLRTGENVPLNIKGRHDPCVARRAVPVIEAAAALTAMDLLLDSQSKVR